MSTAVADGIHLVFKRKKIPLNVWTMIAGRSSLDRKSTSVNLAADIIREAFPHRIAPISGSMEGLLEFLTEEPCSIFVAPELAALLDQMEASYWKQGRSLLMDLYDGRSSYTRKLKGREAVTIRKPRISLLAASAISLLDQTARATDWSGGFLARFLTIYAERSHFLAEPDEDGTKRENLIDDLADLGSMRRATVKATKDARRMHKRFSMSMDDLAQKSPEHLHGPICRLADHVQRVAAIYALTTDSDLGWRHMHQAISFGRLALNSIKAIGDKVTRDPHFRARARVLAVLGKHPEGMFVRDLLRLGPFMKRQLDVILESLVEEERVSIEVLGRKKLVTATHITDRRRRPSRKKNDDEDDEEDETIIIDPDDLN